MNKLGKLVFTGLLMIGLVGCATVDSVGKGTISNNKTGIIYGYATNDLNFDINQLCNSIKNTDERCNYKEKYSVLAIVSSHGFSDSGYGIMALVDSEIKIDKCARPTFKHCTYYKVEVMPNKLGTVISVASNPKELKCDWNGLNGAGGTVCPAYNWDYRKDNGPAVEY
jgi:hypothetical protein